MVLMMCRVAQRWQRYVPLTKHVWGRLATTLYFPLFFSHTLSCLNNHVVARDATGQGGCCEAMQNINSTTHSIVQGVCRDRGCIDQCVRCA